MDNPDDSIDPERIAHSRVGSWFLGPRAENINLLRGFFNIILDDHQKARESIYPEDPDFITKEMMQTDAFKESINRLTENVHSLSGDLAKASVPFWSPRYNGHMLMDTTMPSIIGYTAAMMYNPNNVATEASPYTTYLEARVGMMLCKMLRYGKKVTPWGHITCDGSVANLEAIWAIRNLKFYPLSLKLAMSSGGPLNFLSHTDLPFTVNTCTGHTKNFTDLSTWELLNLTPSTVLELPTRLGEAFSISPAFLQDALSKYLVQTVGTGYLEQKFDIKKSPKFFVSATKHYSWPRGGAITGLGSGSFINVGVDEDARMDIKELRKHLDACLRGDSEDDYTAVFGGVAIIGSTEHGACDPVREIVNLRTEYESKGLSFAIHCDAAWGGYFASLIPEQFLGVLGEPPLVPKLTLHEHTMNQLKYLHYADSITIDPHKSGYINYPAGGLCYRDERMRYLITWTSPIVLHQGEETESIGIYGVEGSKPGASAVATWLTHETLGSQGYERLLGEAIFTCTKLYCYWATLTKPQENLILVPFHRLPSEKSGGSGEDVEKEKQRIRTRILAVKNEELMKDKETFWFMATLGSDLMINAFACNFKINGKPNQDIASPPLSGEANYLNQRIFKRLSATSVADMESPPKLFLTSSSFSEDAYGRCLANFKRRLQLDDGTKPAHGDLTFLVNVTMSPWPTDFPFLEKMVQEFRKIADEEVNRCLIRNEIKPTFHGFVMQGLDRIYLVHMPMFHNANHRWQLIITADYPADVQRLYKELRQKNPYKTYTTANANPEMLSDMLRPGASIEYRMDEGVPDKDTQPLAKFKLSNIRVIVHESLSFDALEKDYPAKMPFYLYGNGTEYHIDHVLKKAPNAQINADRIQVNLTPKLGNEQLAKGVVAVLEDVFEKSIQPLPLNEDKSIKLETPGLNIVFNEKHKTSVYSSYEDFQSGSVEPIATGDITLSQGIFANWKMVNMDPADQAPLKGSRVLKSP
ncbi:pyridoxal phosphate-dependent transferase [Hypoxylon cercidicola]|nr:pyridoxal phosphate-dependent transferase [Hypoxylon cercidicola]